jgi:RNA polymerase primary sigma factor
LRRINKYPILLQEEQALLAKRAKMGDLMARDRLIKSDLRYVVSVALGYAGKGVPLLDLIQEGNQGFDRAIEKFNSKKGTFLSYARHWIRQKVSSAVAEHDRTVGIPINKCILGRLVRNIQTRLFQEKEKEPTPAEIAERIKKNFSEKLKTKPTSKLFARLAKMSAEEVEKVLVETQFPLSMETPVTKSKDGKERRLGDLLKDESVPPPDEAALQSLLRQNIDKAMKGMLDRDKKATFLRFGVGYDTPKTLKEVGKDKDINLTRERVRQIIKITIRKLAHEPKLQGYRQKPKLK